MKILYINMLVKIYTDGACKKNPGIGGWGAILHFNSEEKFLYGAEICTTNNRMELTAALKALEHLPIPCVVELFTDSQYLRLGITQWIKRWKTNGWKNSQKETVKNIDLWQQLDNQSAIHQIHWHWIKGHSGHPENEQADALANRAILDLANNVRL